MQLASLITEGRSVLSEMDFGRLLKHHNHAVQVMVREMARHLRPGYQSKVDKDLVKAWDIAVKHAGDPEAIQTALFRTAANHLNLATFLNKAEKLPSGQELAKAVQAEYDRAEKEREADVRSKAVPWDFSKGSAGNPYRPYGRST